MAVDIAYLSELIDLTRLVEKFEAQTIPNSNSIKPKRCIAITANGKRCSKTVVGRDYCSIHVGVYSMSQANIKEICNVARFLRCTRSMSARERNAIKSQMVLCIARRFAHTAKFFNNELDVPHANEIKRMIDLYTECSTMSPTLRAQAPPFNLANI